MKYVRNTVPKWVFKNGDIDYADYTGFQDYIKNNFTSDYADYAVIKGYYW